MRRTLGAAAQNRALEGRVAGARYARCGGGIRTGRSTGETSSGEIDEASGPLDVAGRTAEPPCDLVVVHPVVGQALDHSFLGAELAVGRGHGFVGHGAVVPHFDWPETRFVPVGEG